MATALNPIEAPGISFGETVAALTEKLRRSTVRITGVARDGSGSGVIWRPDGLIVTNAHVVRSPRQRVELWYGDGHGEEIEGWVCARDDGMDLAVVMISAGVLPAMSVRDAHTLRPGEVVIAVGNPMGGPGAVSVGIVHHTPCSRERLITADVKLSPGNSGGPLADAEGKIVGINTIIAFGLGCAITSNTVAEFLGGSGL
jgi:serine protease Do